MAYPKGYVYYVREFLNLPGEGNAFIEAEVTGHERDRRGTEYFEGGGCLTIKDCARQIRLDFSLYSEAETHNTLTKLSRLMTILETFQAHLIKVAEKTSESRAAYEADKKATAQTATENDGEWVTVPNDSILEHTMVEQADGSFLADDECTCELCSDGK